MHGTCQFPVWTPNPLSINVSTVCSSNANVAHTPPHRQRTQTPHTEWKFYTVRLRFRPPQGTSAANPRDTQVGHSCGESRGGKAARRKIRRAPADRTSVSHKSLFAAAIPHALNLSADETAHCYAGKARRFLQPAQKFTRNTNCYSVTHLQIPASPSQYSPRPLRPFLCDLSG
jgi:hypothetical protein